MVKTFMLLLAFTITGPDGEIRDETVHVLSRHLIHRRNVRNLFILGVVSLRTEDYPQ